jgi:23S rRNA (cytidine1920-2'-O)/16S rRNA (cytidine1409-2'-O)-methyltransferase
MTRRRLDKEIVERGLALTRVQAQVLIDQGVVKINGIVADKAARQVAANDSLIIDADTDSRFVSRAGEKLAGALKAFVGLEVSGKVCADIGASTGGFTDVLLRNGAANVYAVDVGYGQLDWSLASDERVVVLDRVNARDQNAWLLEPKPQIVVCDVSFISASKILPAIVANSAQAADIVVMVKPQFEVGRDLIEKGGVVRNESARLVAVDSLVQEGLKLGLDEVARADSVLKGPAGNQETFVWFRKDLAN